MDRLKAKRTVLRGRTTRIINESKALLSSETASAEELTVLLDRLTICSTDLKDVDTQLETLIPIEDLQQEYDSCFGYQEEIEKFQYLRSLLVGRASAAIEGLQATEACYDDALELLKKRFGDRQQIEHEYLSRLRQLSHIRSSHDTGGLRKMYDQTQSSMRGLKSLGITAGSYAAMMNDILLNALPQDMVLDYHRRKQQQPAQLENSEKQLEDLLDFLQNEVESREKAGISSQDGGVVKRRGSQMSRPSGLVLQTGSEPAKCIFCGSSAHTTERCSSDMDLSARKEKLKSQRRCFRCTWVGHMTNQCVRRVKCDKCKGRHVTSMCDPEYNPAQSTSPKTQTRSAVIATSSATSRSRVLLQTFRAWVVADKKCAYMRGLFDSGSQNTFVREDLVRSLNLPVLREEELSISTFSSDMGRKPERRRIVELQIRSQKLENMLLMSYRSQAYRQVKGISILIGSDQMWKLLKGEIQRYGPNDEVVAINSKLGWTFQGPTTERSLIARQACNYVSVLRVSTLSEDLRCDQLLERFCSLEGVGIVHEDESPSAEGHAVLEEFEKTLKMRDGRYEFQLPWKRTDSLLNDNFEIAKTRLKKLVFRLNRDRHLIEEYDKVVRGYLLSGYVEEIPVSNQEQNTRVFYMPHREVFREASTTTKLRVRRVVAWSWKYIFK
ncbi:uncharacterized protein LOC135369713 [Ornithodoros turicata]|uniref:uncharacterized protein LOC135369713 n=1 Tax=Ornithodoros turicata TaxID=34597 RepID=UPI0031390CF4